MINPTFLLQGPCKPKWTNECVQRIRQFYPDSPIFMSTWIDENLEEIAHHNINIIRSVDPGPLNRPDMLNQNLNRLIVSSKNGLDAIQSEYVCKMRADLLLNAPLPIQAWLDTGKPYMCHTVFSINPHGPMMLGLHISDWLILGKTDRVKEVFNIRLMNSNDPPIRNEQYIWQHASQAWANKSPILRDAYDKSAHAYTIFLIKNYIDIRNLNVDLHSEHWPCADGSYISEALCQQWTHK